MARQAVIFDVDGVLVDSYQAHFRSWQILFNELNIDFTEQQFRNTFGRRSEEILAMFYGDTLSSDQIAEYDDHKEAVYRDILREDVPLIDGAVDLIDQLRKAAFSLGVGSSGPRENILLSLERLDRAHVFGAVITRADVSRGKPDPQVFQLAAAGLDIPADECFVVEDAPAGVEAANRAGMTSIALTGTATRHELSHATLVVDSLRELSPEVLQNL